ncbi:ATP-binding protein [Anaerococcus sp. NML200537]|uniref:ATP-binding protein n=1 Tax=Anaerococcus sp. NML200537 TaxID=2954485 RepID=UPI002237B411|nr:ATP-binding protein [Anaerococcus sp. NML200537]MCW6700919.1 ATP-binding protein [Anaerococcus sp. NML200537]
MKFNYVIGNVISVVGMKINILMNEQSNLESFHYGGLIYDGVSIGSYIGIIRGSYKIICKVDNEFLKDKDNDPVIHEFSRDRFERILEVSLIGNFKCEKFEFGIKVFPMIFNEAVLLSQEEIRVILQNGSNHSIYNLSLGVSAQNNLPIEISRSMLFNTHIGIFGNTGSGKSNTLAKLYTELFNQRFSEQRLSFNNKSKFIVLDFNGEYVKKGIFSEDKKVLNLSTQSRDGDRLNIKPSVYWNIETLSILYSATEKTQQPFLNGAVKYYLDDVNHEITTDKIIEGLGSAFYNVFHANNNEESLKLLLKSLNIINFDESIKELLKSSHIYYHSLTMLNTFWHSKSKSYYYLDNRNNKMFISDYNKESIIQYKKEFKKILRNPETLGNIQNLTATEKLRISVYTHMIYCLSYGKINFEHINPLILRIEARSEFVERTINVCYDNDDDYFLTVINFRKCNSDAKKMLPLLISKQLYEEHKKKAKGFEINSTVHLIIDEAHNILSSQSTRESESWKDYRLEVFEEIIKEGRKFGFYLTIASQRPSDISATIVSQIHNYFLHRLVNEHDIRMIENTVSSLDGPTRSRIPSLAPGQCIITGTNFEMPLLVQVEKLPGNISPTSESADLIKLWATEE